MSSLSDKLRAMKPLPQKPARPAASSCMKVKETLPLAEVALSSISRDTLTMMLGEGSKQSITPRDLLFLDTETTGLSRGVGTLAFLCGTGYVQGEHFVVDQRLMRDYDEEPFVLQHVHDLLASFPVLVTFNGAAFDMPLLLNRFVMNRIKPPQSMPLHIDLLHVARRVYKLRLQRCSLSRLESEVFGTIRDNDLPGAMVPERFFRFLQTREEALLTDILVHNRQDVLSMARLLMELAALHEQPLIAQHHEEIYSLGRVFEKRGEGGRARQCYRAVYNSHLGDLAAIRMAETYRRDKNPARAAAVYERLLAAGRATPQVYIALSRLYEFRLKQPKRALEIAHKGMLYCIECPTEESRRALADLKHRYARLLRKNGGM